METRETSLAAIRQLFETELLAVLATQKEGRPHAGLVAFAATDDLSALVFLTPENTRKFDNLMASPWAAMLVDNSRNKADDTHTAVSVTATGTVRVVADNSRSALVGIYLKRHPHLNEFAEEAGTAVMLMSVDRYSLVKRFQNVVDVQMAP